MRGWIWRSSPHQVSSFRNISEEYSNNGTAPLSGDRKSGDAYESGGPQKYIHFILNQRTLPLGVSFPECGDRDDGWCELETFLKVQSTKLREVCISACKPLLYYAYDGISAAFLDYTLTPSRRSTLIVALESILLYRMGL